MQGLVKVKREKMTTEQKKEFKSSHPLLNDRRFRQLIVPTCFLWAAGQANCWTLGDAATSNAIKAIIGDLIPEWVQYVDNAVVAQVRLFWILNAALLEPRSTDTPTSA
jgi:hypothetical protein